jgi:hypothetical protein
MNHHCILHVIIKNDKSICTHKIHEIQKYEIFLTHKILKLKIKILKFEILKFKLEIHQYITFCIYNIFFQSSYQLTARALVRPDKRATQSQKLPD